MSDAFRYAVLGLAAIAGKREQVQGKLSEIEAARAASEQDFQQQIQLKTLESDLQLGRELALKDREFLNNERAGNIRSHLVKLSDGSIDIVKAYGPVIDKTLYPEGAVQLGVALGPNAGTKDNPYQNALDYEPDVPLPLFNYNGVPGTKAEHVQNYGLGVEFNLGPSVGTRTRKNGNKFYSPDDRRSIFGSKTRVNYGVQGDINEGYVITPNVADANAIRARTGNPVVRITQEVDNNGAAIGEAKEEVFKGQVDLGNRIKKYQTYDLHAPKGKGVDILTDLSETEYLQALQKYGISDPQSVYTEVNNVEEDRFTGEITSHVQDRVITPRDVEITKTTFDIILPNGSSLKSVDAEDVDRHLAARNLSRSEVTLNAYNTIYLNGDIKNHTVNKELSSLPTKMVAFGYVNDRDGNPMIVVGGSSESEWNQQYGNISGSSFAGIRKMVNGKIAEETTVDDAKTILLTGVDADGEVFEVLADDATEEQRRRATSTVAVDVAPDGSYTRTDAPKATDRADLIAKQNVPFTISGDVMDGTRLLGASTDLPEPAQLSRMNATLLEPGILEALKSDPARAQAYVDTFAPVIYTTVDAIRKKQQQEQGTDLLMNKTIAHHVNDLYEGFKNVPGLIAKLRDMDTINLGDAARISNASAAASAAPGELTITAQSSTGTTMDSDNRLPDPSSTGNQTVALSCNVPAANAQFCKDVFIPKLEDIHGPGNPTDIKIIDMMEKQFDADGNPIVDTNGKVELQEAQPVMSVFGEFSRVVVDADTGDTYFDKFVDAANGTTMLDSDYKYLTKAVSAAPSINSAVLHIAPLIKGVTRNSYNEITFIPDSLQDVARRNGIGRFSTTQSNQQYFATIAKQESALKVKKYSGALIGTLIKGYAPDGSVIYHASTGLGELDLTVDGLFYLGNEGLSRFKSFISGGQIDEAGQMIKDNIAAFKDRIYEEQLLLNPADAERIKDDAEFQGEINGIIDDIMTEAKQAETETQRLLAIRQLYIVSLAYELSATMQGGTGGRTISDQDVAIILRALRTKFTASPQQQHAVLEEIGRIADDIYTHTKYRTMRSSDPQKMAEVAAYYFATGMSAVYGDPRGFHRDIDVYAVRDRIMGTGALGKIPDEDVLNSLNMQRRLNNLPPYESYDAIPEAEANEARASFAGT